VSDAGHLDGDGVAEVVFGGTAVAQGHQPSWDPTLATCSDVYCHNADAQGTVPDPVWTDVGSVATCDACHGAPPTAPHPNNTNCGACHSTGGDEPLTVDDLVLHVNGWLQI
jgi:predicted CxxxxCH...CXXCH cytochrome family protein